MASHLAALKGGSHVCYPYGCVIGSGWDSYDSMDVEAGLKLWEGVVAPEAPVGKAMRSRHVVLQAGKGECRTLFVHAGALPSP